MTAGERNDTLPTYTDFSIRDDIINLSSNLGYIFRKPELFEEALTHSSYAHESGLISNNERLEFLGDAVLELCVSTALFEDNPDFDEGELTRARASLVSETPLANWAEKIGVPTLLRLSKGLERQQGRKNGSVLADAMEAVIGAIYLDGGFDNALHVVRRYVRSSEIQTESNEERDYKSQLQEVVQAKWIHPPIYRLVSRKGPDHAAVFEVEVSLPDGTILSAGTGSSIKGAGFAAAKIALDRLKDEA